MTRYLQLRSAERGVGLIEVLVAVSLVTILGMGFAMNTIVSLRANKIVEVGNALHNLAIQRIEEYAGVDAANLSDADDQTENNLTYGNMDLTFTRVTNVTIDADNTRKVDVTVTCNSTIFNSSVSYSSTFALWE